MVVEFIYKLMTTGCEVVGMFVSMMFVCGDSSLK